MSQRDFYKQIEELYCQVREEAAQAGIPVSKDISEVTINSRAKKRLGCCKEIREGRRKKYRIEISSLLEGMEEKQIKEVILHELLHTCPGCMNHGNKWKEYAAKLNRLHGYEITTAADYKKLGIEAEQAVTGNFRYMICCKKCGNKGYRMKKSKVILHPENYKCSVCGGELEVYRLVQRKNL